MPPTRYILVGFSQVKRWENPPEELPNKFKDWIPPQFWLKIYILKLKQ